MRALFGPAAVLLAALAALLPGGPAAAKVDLYTVQGISVDESAPSAAEAKQAAMAEARSEAFGVLLRRLTLGADHGRLPVPDPAAVAAAMRKVQVLDERQSPVRYLARLSVSFHPGPVRALLREAGIPFSEAVSRPVAVFPVYDWGPLRLLFEDANPWRAAWAARPAANEPVPLVLPATGDPAMPSADSAAGGDRARLLQAAARIGARRALVAHAVYRLEGQRTRPVLEVTLRRFGAGDAETALRVEGRAGETVESLCARAAAEAANRIQESWKRANLVAPGAPAEPFEAVASLDGLADLIAVKDALAAAGGVQQVRLTELARSRATFRFRFAGGAERLGGVLERQGLALEQVGGDGWTLRPLDR
ncbi:MAG: DUF2066 domain-containing protein [Alphaproteobacteria bacterium]|nr:DUF2066 domain-containing protein [Alphaproteobacteria bacterium]